MKLVEAIFVEPCLIFMKPVAEAPPSFSRSIVNVTACPSLILVELDVKPSNFRLGGV